MRKLYLIILIGISLNSCAYLKPYSINAYSTVSNKNLPIKDSQKIICVSKVTGKTKQVNALGYFVSLYLQRSGFKVSDNLNACFYKLDINLSSIAGNNQKYSISSDISFSKKINRKNSLIMSDLKHQHSFNYTADNNWDSEKYQVKVVAKNTNLKNYTKRLAIEEHLAAKIVSLISKERGK